MSRNDQRPCPCHAEHVAELQPWCLCSSEYLDLCDVCSEAAPLRFGQCTECHQAIQMRRVDERSGPYWVWVTKGRRWLPIRWRSECYRTATHIVVHTP